MSGNAPGRDVEPSPLASWNRGDDGSKSNERKPDMTQTTGARREELVPFARYRHYEGGLYQILLMAIKEDTGEELVIYQALDGDQKIYAAGVDAFLTEVDPAIHPDAAQRYRFERIGGASEETISDKAKERKEREEEPPAKKSDPEGAIAEEPGESLQPEEDGKNASDDSAQPELDPALERFLDARTTQQRLEILDEMRGRITDGMIDTMAFATGLEIAGERSPRERFDDLRECLLTIQRYETERERLR